MTAGCFRMGSVGLQKFEVSMLFCLHSGADAAGRLHSGWMVASLDLLIRPFLQLLVNEALSFLSLSFLFLSFVSRILPSLLEDSSRDWLSQWQLEPGLGREAEPILPRRKRGTGLIYIISARDESKIMKEGEGEGGMDGLEKKKRKRRDLFTRLVKEVSTGHFLHLHFTLIEHRVISYQRHLPSVSSSGKCPPVPWMST